MFTTQGELKEMSVLSDFEAEAVKFFNTVKADVEKFAHEFVPAVEKTVEVALVDIAQLAGQAVMAELPFAISGAEKFGNAVQHVVQTVEAQGKTIAIQTAQTAVQMAYITAQNVAQGK